jgi:hypothetical protein
VKERALAVSLAEAIAKMQAELESAEEDLGRYTGTLGGQMTANLDRVAELQRALADLKAKEAERR